MANREVIREARERQEDEIRPPPEQKITDPTELANYRLRKRKEYEDMVTRARWNKNACAWVKYARWEESYKDFKRARSVWERALDVDYTDHTMWLNYAGFEMRNKFIGNARNVWDRAVTLLPRVDQLWYKYIHMEEELLGNVEGARRIFERWMSWEPDQHAWLSYIEFELRYKEFGRVRDLYESFVQCVPKVGDREVIEDAIVGKRRFQYEEQVRKNPLNYDSWFDYVRHEESFGNKERVREVYERAIANVPPADKKIYWQRYIYLWKNYALYEELEAKDVSKTRDVYSKCLKLIPHNKFSFANIWLLAAQFEIRQLNLSGARSILGKAIGMAPKDKIFKKYIEIELQLGNIHHCRKLYEKYLVWSPGNCYAWSKYAELERSLSESERARAIFELATAQAALDMPELLWKAYIDFEISEGEFERTRQLYERLLERTKHLKVWISYAKFEASAIEEVEQEEEVPENVLLEQRKLCIERARRVFENAINYYKTSAPELKGERAMLSKEWLKMESSFHELGDIELVRVKLPKKLKKRRQIEINDGPAVHEEYIDYLFPEELKASNLKILEQAYKWKKRKVSSSGDEDEDDIDD